MKEFTIIYTNIINCKQQSIKQLQAEGEGRIGPREARIWEIGVICSSEKTNDDVVRVNAFENVSVRRTVNKKEWLSSQHNNVVSPKERHSFSVDLQSLK